MSRFSRTASVRVVIAALLAVGLSACDITVGAAEYKVREEKRFAITGASQVHLSTFDGSIEIRGWDRPEILIEVEKQGSDQQATDAIKVNATHEGGTVTIDIPKPPGIGSTNWRRSPSARIVASIPIQSNLVVRSGDGSISVDRVTGTIDLRTDDGSVKLDEARGTLLVRTNDGAINGEDVDGTIDAQTGDGSIVLEGVMRGVRLDTEDGSVKITARKGSATEADWSVTTGDGSIRAELPKGFGAEVDAQSGDGRVYVEGLTKDPGDQSGDHERESQREGRRSARGSLGGGGKLMKLRTGDGSINVRVW
jgi:DUF4097 and DUF4098 domain-containing protein YvlB